jgi:hypothetical protein
MEAALRDGRLCLSTLALLGQVLTDENADELLGGAEHVDRFRRERQLAPNG